MPRSSGRSSAASPSADGRLEGVLVRPTRPGALAVALLLGAGIVAVNAGNNLLYLVVSCLLALLALSGVLGHANLRGLELRALPHGEVFAGRPFSLVLEVANRRRRLPAYLIEAEGADGTVLEIGPGDAARLTLDAVLPLRGLRPYPPRRVTSEFPLGLIRRGGLWRPAGSCLVYPRPIPVPWEAVERAEREGDRASRRSAGVGGDYRGLRQYAPGDRLSRVHWPSWLRLRRLQTKEFEAEGAPPATFAWEDVPGPGTEERLGQLTWLVRTGLRRGRSVGLVLPGRTLAPGTGPAHRRELLAALALFDEAPP